MILVSLRLDGEIGDQESRTRRSYLRKTFHMGKSGLELNYICVW